MIESQFRQRVTACLWVCLPYTMNISITSRGIGNNVSNWSELPSAQNKRAPAPHGWRGGNPGKAGRQVGKPVATNKRPLARLAAVAAPDMSGSILEVAIENIETNYYRDGSVRRDATAYNMCIARVSSSRRSPSPLRPAIQSAARPALALPRGGQYPGVCHRYASNMSLEVSVCEKKERQAKTASDCCRKI